MLKKIPFLLITVLIIEHSRQGDISKYLQSQNDKNVIGADNSIYFNKGNKKYFVICRLLNWRECSNDFQAANNQYDIRSHDVGHAHASSFNSINLEKATVLPKKLNGNTTFTYSRSRTVKGVFNDTSQEGVKSLSLIDILKVRQHLPLKRRKRSHSRMPSSFVLTEDYFRNQIERTTINMEVEWERYIFCQFGRKTNKRKLLSMFSLICPVKESCHMNLTESQFQYSGRSSFKGCNPCRCDSSCVSADACCPGSIYGYMPYECTNLVLFSAAIKANNIVTRCPVVLQNTSLSIKCSGPKSELNPVLSYRSGVTYKNTYCASCHNDTVHTHLNLTVQCSRNITFSYHGSLTKAKEALKNNDCLIRYHSNITHQKCSMKNKSTIKTCNVTGLWQKFDADVNWACENFKLTFKEFQNVFCYICNPSITSTHNTISILSCNVTGMWKRYDPLIEQACNKYGHIERISPFKNVYCALCNGIESSNRLLQILVKHNISSLSQVSTTKIRSRYRFYYDGSPPSEFLKEHVPKLRQVMDKILTNNTEIRIPQKSANDTNFTEDYFMIRQAMISYAAVCGEASICDKSLINGSDLPLKIRNPICGQCSCNTDCVFGNKKCCVDVLLQKDPYSCYKYSTTPSHDKTMNTDYLQDIVENDNHWVFAVDRCIGDTPQWIKRNCEDTINNDTIYAAAILGSGTIFKNIYCFICNTPWKNSFYLDVHYYCGGYVEPWLFANAEHVLSYVTKYCTRSFTPDEGACNHGYTTSPFGIRHDRVRPELIPANGHLVMKYSVSNLPNVTIYNSCNISKTWSDYITVIKDICEGESATLLKLPEYRESLNIYKNVACLVCNPKNEERYLKSGSVVSTCDNETSWYDETMETRCKEGSYTPLWLPYNNFHCQNCNLPPLHKVYVGERTETGISDSSYRTLFTLASDDWQKISRDNHDKDFVRENLHHCNSDTYGKCQTIHCRMGLTLSNKSCTPFLETAYNVTYEVRLTVLYVRQQNCETITGNVSCDSTTGNDSCDSITGNVSCDSITGSVFEHNICDVFVSALKQGLTDAGDFIVNSCNLINVTDCKENQDSCMDKCQYSLINRVTLQQTNTLSLFENRLMSFLLKVIDLQESFAQCCQISFSFQFPHETYEVNTRNTKNNQMSLIHVSRCFNCPYIKLNTSEFHFDDINFQKEIDVGGVSIPAKYIGWSELNACLCLEDYIAFSTENYKQYVVPKKSLFVTIHNIYSNVCTIISLVCLFATFLTYCLFSFLRTVPGKNNMCLVFTLFVAQSSFGFLHWQTPTRSYCISTGIVLHYFWLATFFSMNVCSFHMFRLFSVRWFFHADSEQRTQLKYLVYTFVAPLVITSLTVFLNLLRSNYTYLGYGKGHCFLSDFHSLLLAFTIPSSAVFTVNIVFYISALCSIRTIRNRVRNVQDRRDLITYVKLCTVVGATWPLLIIDGSMDVSWFSFIAVGVNALQGVFIFVSYVLNARVLNMYKTFSCCRNRPALAMTYGTRETKT